MDYLPMKVSYFHSEYRKLSVIIISMEIKNIDCKKELSDFIFLPEKLHRGHRNWVPPIYPLERRFFNPDKNRAFSYSDTLMAMAYLDGKPQGRIMGIINKRYNGYRQEKNARFGYLECLENQHAAHELLNRVEQWAREKGMTRIVGPMGFNNQDPAGFLTEGFEHEPTVSTYYNYPYLNRLLENEGYTKEVDYVVYKVDIPERLPEIYNRIFERIVQQGKYRIIEFTRREQIRPHIIPMLELMNECFTELYGFQPLDKTEMNDLAIRYLRILDPRFITVVKKDEETIAFNIAMPNLSAGIRKARGRLYPFGFLQIQWQAKRSRQLDTLIGGIREEYRGRGIDVLMICKTISAARKAGMRIADSHHEMEDNHKIRAEMERLGGVVYKRFRVYGKEL